MKESKKMSRGKKKKNEEKPAICLFVEHGCPEMGHSVYLIQPTLDLGSEISPALTFPEKDRFLINSASVNLGAKIYFFGGMNSCEVLKDPKRNALQVQVFDTEHPNLGIRSVAPMHTAKQSPCVFVADGMIYAFGSEIDNQKLFPGVGGCQGTGLCERYDPSSDQWQVLPDPPFPLSQLEKAVTVVGRRVFVWLPCLIFNLDALNWDPVPPTSLSLRFPYGSLYSEATASLYHLRGHGVFKPGYAFIPENCRFGETLQVVKTGPLPTNTNTNTNRLLKSPCLDPGMHQIVASASDLDDPEVFFADYSFRPWRDLFHMGGRFFCYVVTAQLIDLDSRTVSQPFSRGVWIKFIEEVPAQTQTGTGTGTGAGAQFRTLASFCYEIKTDFRNHANIIHCSVLGSVPQSWIKAPPGKKLQESKLLSHKGSEVLQMEANVLDQSSVVEAERKDAVNRETGNADLMKLLAVREEENRMLAAELSRKDELLKAYEAMLAKTGGMAGLSVS